MRLVVERKVLRWTAHVCPVAQCGGPILFL